MSLLVVYAAMVIVGQTAAVFLSLFIDRYTHDGLALTIFFVIFFSTFVALWPVAIWLTKPKNAAA